MAHWYSNPFAQFAFGVVAGAGAIVLVSRSMDVASGLYYTVNTARNASTEGQNETAPSQSETETFGSLLEGPSHVNVNYGTRNSDGILDSLSGVEGDNVENNALMDLLFQVAKDQAHRDSFIHRGITCNMCNASPVCGTRYKCANCLDYDVCEVCEPGDHHDRTHVFLKIKYPIPPLANPKAVCLKPFYTGMLMVNFCGAMPQDAFHVNEWLFVQHPHPNIIFVFEINSSVTTLR